MSQLSFTPQSIVGLISESALMILIPIVLLLIWKKKSRESYAPAFIGALIWLSFAIVLKSVPTYFLLQASNPVAKTVAENNWLAYAVAGALAGVFEESGRFIAFKFFLKKYDNRKTAITYGIGHGGFESIYIGFQLVSIIVLALVLNGPSAGLISQSADESQIALLTTQLEQYSDISFWECLLAVFERFSAIILHISLSVLVFASVKDRKRVYLYPAAVILHLLFDFSIVFYQNEYITVWVMELILFAFAVLTAIFASKIYKSYIPLRNDQVE